MKTAITYAALALLAFAVLTFGLGSVAAGIAGALAVVARALMVG